jgi:ribosomal protein S18 acetylase RimI-like enzyme
VQVRAVDRPAESLGVRDEEIREAFERSYPSTGAEWVATLFGRRDRGGLRWGQFEARDGSPLGAVGWELVPRVGRRVALWYLDPGHATGAALGATLRAFEEFDALNGPPFFWPDAVPGVSVEEQARVLEPAGLIHFDRARMVFPRRAEVPGAALGRGWRLRHPTPADDVELFEVARRAYRDYPGQLEWTYVDLERDLSLYAEHLRDRPASVVREATFVAEVRGRVRGNVVTRRTAAGPCIDSVQVDPRWQGRGLGRALMVRALDALAAGPVREDVRLRYLRQNERGGRLYRSVGFRPEPQARGPEDGYWLRRKTLRAVLARPANEKFR